MPVRKRGVIDPVPKKAPAKKAAKATKKAAPAEDNGAEEAAEKAAMKATKKAEAEAKRTARKEQYDENQAEVVRLRDEEGLSLKAIAEQLNLNQVTAQVMYIRATQPKVNRKPTPDTIVKMRDDDKIGWARIGASFDPVLTKAQVQALYKEAGHDPHMSFVGKGGRYGKYEEHRPAKPPAEKRASKRASKKAAPITFEGMSAADVKDAIDGKTIKYTDNGAEATVKIGSGLKVGKTARGKMLAKFTDDNGLAKTVAIEDITSVR